jgi:hypothetical protein
VIVLTSREWRKRWRGMAPRALAVIRRGMGKGVDEGVRLLREATLAAGAVDTGRLANAWTKEVGAESVRVFNRMVYATFVEHGRRAGARMPPRAPIERWARSRLGLSAEEARAAAYPIARAIAERGIRARPVGAKTLPAIRRAVSRAVRAELVKVRR